MTQPNGKGQPPWTAQSREQGAWPPIDLTREGHCLVLWASLPGLRASDFRVSLVGNRQVYIDGTVPYRHPVPKESLTLSERAYGPFSRKIDLPLPVDTRGAELRFELGVLTARLPLMMQRVGLHWSGAGGDPYAGSTGRHETTG